MAVLHTPRIVALIPGQSPPEVKIPILMVFIILKSHANDTNLLFGVKIRKKNGKKHENPINKLTFARVNQIFNFA